MLKKIANRPGHYQCTSCGSITARPQEHQTVCIGEKACVTDRQPQQQQQQPPPPPTPQPPPPVTDQGPVTPGNN